VALAQGSIGYADLFILAVVGVDPRRRHPSPGRRGPRNPGVQDGRCTVTISDAKTGRELQVLNGDAEVSYAAFSPDKRRMATCCFDGTVRLWDAGTGDELVKLISANRGADWLVATWDGYFDGSPGGTWLIQWRVGGAIFPVERFENEHRRADHVAHVLNERPTAKRKSHWP
jgi:hypothetical protein